MARLALAVVLTAAAGITAVVVHPKRPASAVSDQLAPVTTLPLPLNVRASRGEHRLPLLGVKANARHAGQGAKPHTHSSRRGSGPSRPHGATAPSAGPAPSNGNLNWPALAQCESGGDPRTNTGNGFYGAYQFDRQTWRSVGGHGLPSDNSLAEQTYRARLLFDERGREPWPVCGRFL